jgi:hypothetical protein
MCCRRSLPIHSLARSFHRRSLPTIPTNWNPQQSKDEVCGREKGRGREGCSQGRRGCSRWVRHIVEDVSKVALGDLDLSGVNEPNGGGRGGWGRRGTHMAENGIAALATAGSPPWQRGHSSSSSSGSYLLSFICVSDTYLGGGGADDRGFRCSGGGGGRWG